jgi:hypothetical protein
MLQANSSVAFRSLRFSKLSADRAQDLGRQARGRATSKCWAANKLYTKSERLTVSCRVTWAWSESVNLYSRQIMVLLRETETYITCSGTRPPFRTAGPPATINLILNADCFSLERRFNIVLYWLTCTQRLVAYGFRAHMLVMLAWLTGNIHLIHVRNDEERWTHRRTARSHFGRCCLHKETRRSTETNNTRS